MSFFAFETNLYFNIFELFQQGTLASIMISIYRQMSPDHFKGYINHFVTRQDLLDFLMEILMVFKDLISRPVYPTDWCEMILLQNRYI